jgi:hypothetical protein
LDCSLEVSPFNSRSVILIVACYSCNVALRSASLFLIFAVGLAFAQSANDATSLVADAATFAREGTSWIAEGSFVTEENGGNPRSVEQFRIVYQLAPSIRARLEITSGENSLLRICDGASQWTYYPHINRYVRVILPQISPCVGPINSWPPILHSAQSTGSGNRQGDAGGTAS